MHRILNKKNKLIFIPVLIFLVALFLRFLHLTIIPVFGDEAIYIRWAQIMQADAAQRFLPLTDGKQPLFMWLMIPFFKFIQNPLAAGRLVSVFAGCGTLIGIFTLSFLIFKSFKLAAFSSFIYSVTPFALFFDRLAIADSLLSMFGIWVFIFTFLTFKKVRLDSAMITGFFLGGAMLTKSTAIIFAVLMPIFSLLTRWPKNIREKFKRVFYYLYLFTFTGVIAFGLYNILRLGPAFHMIAIRNMDYVYPLSHVFSSPFDPLKPFLIRSFQYFWIMGPWPLIFMVIAGLIYGLKEKRKETVLVLLLAIIPVIVVCEYQRVLTARYIFFTLPYFCILAGLSWLGFSGGIKTRSGLFGILLTTVFVISALRSDFLLLTDPQKASLPNSERTGYLEGWTSGYGIYEVSRYLAGHYSESSGKIYVGTEGFFGTLPDGLEIFMRRYPVFEVFGTGVDFSEVPTELLQHAQKGDKTFFVVNSSRLHRDYRELPLKLISEYPKAIKADGNRDYLYFFEVQNMR